MDRRIYDRLKEAAKGIGIIYYGEIAPLADLNMSLESIRESIRDIIQQ